MLLDPRPALQLVEPLVRQVLVAARPEAALLERVEREEAAFVLFVLILVRAGAAAERLARFQPLPVPAVAALDQVVVLPALAAEGEREQHPPLLVPVAPLHPELPLARRRERAVDAAPGGQPLVQPEGEHRLLALAPLGHRRVARFEHVAQAAFAFGAGAARLPCQPFNGIAERDRRMPKQDLFAPLLALLDPERLLGPGRERVILHRIRVLLRRRR